MTTTIVVHTEGPGDHGHPPDWAAPGDPLMEDDLGPAHELVRRALQRARSIPAAGIDFRTPFRTATGEHLHGSRLLRARSVDEALRGWRFQDVGPVFVMICDADDDDPASRREKLRDAVYRNGLRGAVGVSVREFESWLVSDAAALRQVLGRPQDVPHAPEELARREAKQLLAEWIAPHVSDARSALQIRREIAAALDLEVAERACPSFRAFLQELEALEL